MENSEVRYFTIGEGAGVTRGFNPDHDVLVLAGTGLSRKDLRFEQRGGDTVIARAESGQELAVIADTDAFDLDPVPMLSRFYEAFGENNIDKIRDFLATDILWEAGGPTDILPWAGSWKGIVEVEKYFDLLNDKLAFEKLAPTRFIAQGNTVAVVLNGQGETRSGVTFEGGAVHWITVRNGKISSLQRYGDTFPIIEAIYGGRPFTLEASRTDWHDHVVPPVASPRKTDNIVFETGEQKPARTVTATLAMYGALQRLDVDEMRTVFTEDVVWQMLGPSDLIEWSGKWIGPEAALESVNAIIRTMHFEHFKPVRMISDGDTAAVLIDEPGSSRATGLPFHTSVAHIITANEDGRISHFTNYVDTTGIVEAFLGGRPCVIGAPKI